MLLAQQVGNPGDPPAAFSASKQRKQWGLQRGVLGVHHHFLVVFGISVVLGLWVTVAVYCDNDSSPGSRPRRLDCPETSLCASVEPEPPVHALASSGRVLAAAGASLIPSPRVPDSLGSFPQAVNNQNGTGCGRASAAGGFLHW